MSKPFGVEEEWVEICDSTGKKASMRFLATVRYEDKNYFILGAADPDDLDEEGGGFMLVREDQTVDGANEYVITSDEAEIENVVDMYVAQSLIGMLEESLDVTDDCFPCGVRHLPGEFCACDIPELLQ